MEGGWRRDGSGWRWQLSSTISWRLGGIGGRRWRRWVVGSSIVVVACCSRAVAILIDLLVVRGLPHSRRIYRTLIAAYPSSRVQAGMSIRNLPISSILSSATITATSIRVVDAVVVAITMSRCSNKLYCMYFWWLGDFAEIWPGGYWGGRWVQRRIV